MNSRASVRRGGCSVPTKARLIAPAHRVPGYSDAPCVPPSSWGLNAEMKLTHRFMRWCARGTDYSKMPHVCFRVCLGTGARAGKEFSKIFKCHLRAQFDSVWVIYPWLWRAYGAAKAMRKELFLFNFWPSARDPRELVLAIHPADNQELLITVCREIHLFLTETPGVTRVWWYFRMPEFLRESPEPKVVGVWTPDDLPWDSQQAEYSLGCQALLLSLIPGGYRW